MVITSNGVLTPTRRLSDPARPELDCETLRQEENRQGHERFGELAAELNAKMVQDGICEGRTLAPCTYHAAGTAMVFPVVSSAEEFRAFFDETLNPALYHRPSGLDSMPWLAACCYQLCLKWARLWVVSQDYGQGETGKDQDIRARSLASDWYGNAVANILSVVADEHRVSKGPNKGLCLIEVLLRRGNGRFPIMWLVGGACRNASRTARNKRYMRAETPINESHESIDARFSFRCEGFNGWVDSVARLATKAGKTKQGELERNMFRALNLICFYDDRNLDLNVGKDKNRKEALVCSSLKVSRGMYRTLMAELAVSYDRFFLTAEDAAKNEKEIRAKLARSLGFAVAE